MKAGALALLALVLCLGSHGAGAQSIPVGAAYGCKPNRACAGPFGAATATAAAVPCVVGTNYAFQSEAFNTTWVNGYGGSGTVTANQATAPDGTLTMDFIENVSAALDASVSQTVTVASSTTFTFSVWARAVSGTGIVSIGLAPSTGTVSAPVATRDDAGAITAVVDGSNAYAFAYATVGTTSVRLSFTVTTNQARTTMIPFVAGGRVQVSRGSGYFWGGMLESGVATASTYVKTTTAAATTVCP